MAPTRPECNADAHHLPPASTQVSPESSTNSSIAPGVCLDLVDSAHGASNCMNFVKDKLKAVTPPQSTVDFFQYSHDLGCILSDCAGLLFMLEPLSDGASPLEKNLSDRALKLFRTRVPRNLRADLPLTSDVSQFLKELRALTPPFFSRAALNATSRPTWRTPERQRHETLRDFLARFEFWRDRHNVPAGPASARFFAGVIWAQHVLSYDTRHLESSFVHAQPHFASLDDAYRWFRSHSEFDIPLRPLVANGRLSSRSSAAQGSKQASPTNPKGRGSSQKYNVSQTNSASQSKHNQGNVNKSGNAKTAMSNKRSRSKKQTSPRSDS